MAPFSELTRTFARPAVATLIVCSFSVPKICAAAKLTTPKRLLSYIRSDIRATMPVVVEKDTNDPSPNDRGSSATYSVAIVAPEVGSYASSTFCREGLIAGVELSKRLAAAK